MDPVEKELRKNAKLRSEKHLTLGKLISYLQTTSVPKVANLVNPHSYRGYYTDLAFVLETGEVSREEMLRICKNLVGMEFMGYKGGFYKMSYNTPLWIANYGDCGKPFMGLDGTNVTLG